VGWSAREGSGVFDPVEELQLPYDFYKLDDHLHIDLQDMEECLRRNAVRVIVLIHYFGYTDPNYAAVIALAHRYGAMVLEDEAHAMLTDWVGGECGRLGDAAIYSLHKLLPVPRGGILAVSARHASLLDKASWTADDIASPWIYDLFEIAARRRENAMYLTKMLEPLSPELEPLWGPPSHQEVPQTFPVKVKTRSRDELYFALNEAGFGAVSLYHTLITQIRPEQFPDSHQIARTIINFPVHQDVSLADLTAMIEWIKQYLHIIA
jgi:dTDP-4-amino-4,6-dideoxygalactose transaminase